MVRQICIGALQGYRTFVSPLLGPRCRFYPSCSEFAILSLEKDPFTTAIIKTVKRLCRCHPWHPGGVDFP